MRVDSNLDTAHNDNAERTTRVSDGSLASGSDWPTAKTPAPETDAERTQYIAAGPTDFPEFSAEKTQSIPRVTDAPPTASWSFGGNLGGPPQPPSPGAPSDGLGGDNKPGLMPAGIAAKPGLMRAGVIAGIAAGVLLLLYVADLAFTSGTVPRGTVVADVAVGGMDKAAAERKLREQFGPELDKPVRIDAGDTQLSLSPKKAGLSMDWSATLEQAGSQPLNPITRITSLFTSREITPVSRGDRNQLNAALEDLKPQLDRTPSEGAIRFDGANPVAVEPVVGRTVDIGAAADAVRTGWLSHKPVQVPFSQQPVSTTTEGVHKALDEVAKPAVSGPVTVLGEGKQASLSPEGIARSLRFEPDGRGGLKPSVDIPAVQKAVEPQLADTIKPGQDAQIVLENNAPVVHPSVDGHGVDWNKSFERLLDVYKQRGNRSVQAIYLNQPARFTTDQANQLGIREVVSQFSTGGFEPASGVNIKRTAEQVNGAIVKPGDTFSLNGYTGPRGIPQGYIESGVIEDGVPSRYVGGGISQFATTLFNASYFAGMKDVEHKAHSMYIKRYPMGREATVFQSPDGGSVIDVKFKNVSTSGVLISTEWTPQSITVKFWSTKQFDVSSQTGPQTDQTPPELKQVPPGKPCSPSQGEPGFTVTDTRTIRNLQTGQVTVERPSKTRYDPHPIINCPPPGPPPPPG